MSAKRAAKKPTAREAAEATQAAIAFGVDVAMTRERVAWWSVCADCGHVERRPIVELRGVPCDGCFGEAWAVYCYVCHGRCKGHPAGEWRSICEACGGCSVQTPAELRTVPCRMCGLISRRVDYCARCGGPCRDPFECLS